ncbi:LLM class flavin-dependent oxidoreductase [Timonella sp. A28]|uniref:LLM class flavin-dependent oxidoreductase n=1 Tax=Timonella sp. A28 TaxID=3442640 RepID=UPI003EBC94E6
MTKFSLLDLAPISPEHGIEHALSTVVDMAQAAERSGYSRVWYAEHHNMPIIASSATSVLIAHVAAHTSTIRLGSGGIMLPNHAPLVIAEQFGTLEALHPGRIDLGLGRAPGGDRNTLRALRRNPMDADRFPQDIAELQGYLNGNTVIEGVHAIPGKGTHIPLYILGSSLFGAKLAAQLGLPYAFASHFAPQALHDALDVYRRDFQPSQQLSQPYVIAAMNAVAAPNTARAQTIFHDMLRHRLKALFLPPEVAATITDNQVDDILESPQGLQVRTMLKYTAVGTAEETRDWAHGFVQETQADEIIVAHQAADAAERVRSVELFGQALLNNPV